MAHQEKSRLDTFRQKVYIIIYGVNTPAGKLFDIALLLFIALSVIVIMLQTIPSVNARFHSELWTLEWIFTALFTLEYAMRIYCTDKPLKYIFSFYGIIDLLAIVPMYLSFFFIGSNVFSSIRTLRLLRLFRVLKLFRFIEESTKLKVALKSSRPKITVFLYTIMIISMTIGTLMYFVEGEENGFTSIPQAIYWTIVTLTTVGYGDIVPQTAAGQILSVILMITGYGIIAVPTGIVSVELAKQASSRKENEKPSPPRPNDTVCMLCNSEGHREGAEYCYNCGNKLKL